MTVPRRLYYPDIMCMSGKGAFLGSFLVQNTSLTECQCCLDFRGPSSSVTCTGNEHTEKQKTERKKENESPRWQSVTRI